MGNLLIKYYPPRRASVNTLFSHIKTCEVTWGIADLIIVDYGDKLMATVIKGQ